MKLRKKYNVCYHSNNGYDLLYENNVKCIKKLPKTFRVEREDGSKFLIIKDNIIELTKL